MVLTTPCYKDQPLLRPICIAKTEFLKLDIYQLGNQKSKCSNYAALKPMGLSGFLGCGCQKCTQNPDAQPVTKQREQTLNVWEHPVIDCSRGVQWCLTDFVPIFSFTLRDQVCPTLTPTFRSIRGGLEGVRLPLSLSPLPLPLSSTCTLFLSLKIKK